MRGERSRKSEVRRKHKLSMRREQMENDYFMVIV